MPTKISKADWLVPAGLIALTLVPALAGTARLVEVSSGTAFTPQNARFLADPLPVVLHIPTAIIYGFLGALQFSAGFRRRRPAWHRTAGRILVPTAVVVAMSGLWMTLAYPWPAGDGVLVYLERLVFGGAMLIAVSLGVQAIRRRDFAAHGAWMTRAYAIGLGAGTQVFTHLPWFLLAEGWPGETARGVMMGAGWVINVMAAELYIRRRALRRTVTPNAMRNDGRSTSSAPALCLNHAPTPLLHQRHPRRLL